MYRGLATIAVVAVYFILSTLQKCGYQSTTCKVVDIVQIVLHLLAVGVIWWPSIKKLYHTEEVDKV